MKSPSYLNNSILLIIDKTIYRFPENGKDKKRYRRALSLNFASNKILVEPFTIKLIEAKKQQLNV